MHRTLNATSAFSIPMEFSDFFFFLRGRELWGVGVGVDTTDFRTVRCHVPCVFEAATHPALSAVHTSPPQQQPRGADLKRQTDGLQTRAVYSSGSGPPTNPALHQLTPATRCSLKRHLRPFNR